MNRRHSTIYRIKRGLKNPLYSFDYKNLEKKLMAWTVRGDTDQRQATLNMYEGL